MEDKKSSGAVVVIAILCLLIGFAAGCFISTNYLNKKENNNQNNTSKGSDSKSDNTEEKKCKYEKLKDPALLTDDEKNQIYSQIDYIISPETKKITKSDDYTYLVSFEYQDADATGSTAMFVTFWKENGAWKHGDYLGSGFLPGSYGESLMCAECGDCANN